MAFGGPGGALGAFLAAVAAGLAGGGGVAVRAAGVDEGRLTFVAAVESPSGGAVGAAFAGAALGRSAGGRRPGVSGGVRAQLVSVALAGCKITRIMAVIIVIMHGVPLGLAFLPLQNTR